jgi:hypothetical protein
VCLLPHKGDETSRPVFSRSGDLPEDDVASHGGRCGLNLGLPGGGYKAPDGVDPPDGRLLWAELWLGFVCVGCLECVAETGEDFRYEVLRGICLDEVLFKFVEECLVPLGASGTCEKVGDGLVGGAQRASW